MSETEEWHEPKVVERNWQWNPRKWSRNFTIYVVSGFAIGAACLIGLVVGLVFGLRRTEHCDPTVKNLPSFPLAVKSPYLSAWVPGDEIKDAPTAQAEFWTGDKLLWPVLARVDNVTYSLFGNAASSGLRNLAPATTNLVNYTSSHTYVELTAGQANITLDFFSPVLPSKADYARHSLPYSYLTVSVASNATSAASVQILSAIDYTWTGQDGSSDLNFTTSGDAGFFWFHNPNAVPFTEKDQRASHGSILFGMNTSSATSQTCDTIEAIYNAFKTSGSLSNATKPCSGTDVAALSKDLGISSEPQTATFVIGLDRTEAIRYLNTTTYTGYYRTRWPTIPQAVEQVVGDYDSVLEQSLDLDVRIRSRSEAVSSTYGVQYADIVEASVRQAFGGFELTAPSDNLTAPPWAFIKEISTDGNVNTVDLLSQSWPIFVSLNPEYIILLFEPILHYLSTGGWPHPWAVHDLGMKYPNATGHNDGHAEQMPLFETSTLFILMYAYQKLTADTSYTQRYSSLLNGYASYLAENSLFPDRQLMNVDDLLPTANQTGLAVLSAIGLKAASILTGNDTYATIATSHAKVIYDDGLGLDGVNSESSTHFTYNYNKNTTWGVLFPAFFDQFLNLSTFPASAWDMQSSWYSKNMGKEGLAFAGSGDEPSDYVEFEPRGQRKSKRVPFTLGITDWNIITAAASSDAVSEAVVSTTHSFLTNGLNRIPFGTMYHVDGPEAGKWVRNKAKSSAGGHFAILAMKQGYWYGDSVS